MAAILATRFPDKAPEFLAYMAIIVRAERNYDGTDGQCTTVSSDVRPWPGKT